MLGWQVLFLSASEEINRQPDVYWTSVMDIARKNNLARIIRSPQPAAPVTSAPACPGHGKVSRVEQGRLHHTPPTTHHTPRTHPACRPLTREAVHQVLADHGAQRYG